MLVAAVGAAWLDWAHNWGWEFGYYRQYNRVRHLLRSLPGVSITHEWFNHDIRLEEFKFWITAEGRPVELGFSESDPVRTMPRDSARTELKRWIAEELSRDPAAAGGRTNPLPP
jgi:hypothetical protein